MSMLIPMVCSLLPDPGRLEDDFRPKMGYVHFYVNLPEGHWFSPCSPGLCVAKTLGIGLACLEGENEGRRLGPLLRAMWS